MQSNTPANILVVVMNMIITMSTGRFPQLVFMLIILLSLVSTQNVLGFTKSGVEDDNVIKCIEKERRALLMIKQSLVDDYGRLSSWGAEENKKECCKWRGVSCSNRTGHVVKLSLQDLYLTGNISSSMLELQHLNYLDLSWNDFGGQPIPEFIGSLHKLHHLDLSESVFGGRIPHQLGNLSRLQYLDLGSNLGMYGGKLEWLSRLSFLRHLRLDLVDLREVVDWQQVISKLPSLTQVLLIDCNLPSVTSSSSVSFVNSSKSLALLHLSWNNLTHSIYHLLSNFRSSLVDIDLSVTMLQGPIPKYAFSKMTSLQHLDLSSNKLQGPIPEYAFSDMTSLQLLDLSENQIGGISSKTFTNTCSLKTLYLRSNNLTVQLSDLLFNLSDCTKQTIESLDLFNNTLGGSLPDFSEFISMRELDISYNRLNAITPGSIGQLFKLEYLDISSNSLEGTITETHMSNLSKLTFLDLSSNLLTLKFSYGWVPSFQLQAIRLMGCKQGPYFPKWLQTQKNFSVLDISNNNISDTIPTWFWDLSLNLVYLNLSYNHMKGILPDLSLKFVGYPGIDLSSNNFEGPIPIIPSNVTSLNLSKNKFSGSLSFLCSVNGTFLYLDLSNNLLSGELPNCPWPTESLVVLNLANNNFSGNFPNLMGSYCTLQSLKLRNNNFVGELPQSLNMCTGLKIFDVGDNNFSGTIPEWIGDSLPNLRVLALRSNQFNKSIPLQLCQLSDLQLVDFSLNNISGTIPKCLNNLTAMVQKLSSDSTIEISYPTYYFDRLQPAASSVANYGNTAILVWKGMDREYKENLGYLTSIDLSSNKLYGEIPLEITSLEGLRALNLSRNCLTGPITPKIGNLDLLDSFDLSNNKLVGEIPPNFSSLSFLGMLDLSNNNLSGKIPFNTKLQSFEATAYMGNPDLCGLPLPNKCPEPEAPAIIRHYRSNVDDGIVTLEFYVCMAIGFIVGFWGVLGSLLLKRSWRHAYFQFLNHANDRLYIAIVLAIAKLQRWPRIRS